MRRVIGAILIVEAAIAGLATLQAIPALAGYDLVAIVLILAGAAIGALQLISGVQLLERRASGPTLGPFPLSSNEQVAEFRSKVPRSLTGWHFEEVGTALATTALALSAIVTTMVVGFRWAPSDVYYWYRWQFVAGYWIYAAAAIWYLRRRQM